MMRFEGKTAIVTGAAGGIGAAIVRLLAAEGAEVFAADVNEDALRHDARRVTNYACDVTSNDQVEAMVSRMVDSHGRLDLLFNNAGTGKMGDITETTDEDWERVFKVNITSIMYASRAAVPHMRRQGGGAIVNTGSVSGIGGDYGFGAYNASKGAVINYTRALAVDLGCDNIRVNAFCPGFIPRTGLTNGLEGLPVRDIFESMIPMRRGGTTEEMANVAAFLASDAASYVTGAILMADGGMTAHTGQPNLWAATRELMAGP